MSSHSPTRAHLLCQPVISFGIGYAPASAIGVRAFTLVHPGDVVATRASFGRARQHDTGGTAFRLRHADGSWRWFEADSTYVAENGQCRLLIIGRDITERKRLEAELHRLQKLDTIGRLTGGVIHDFNSRPEDIGTVSSQKYTLCVRDYDAAAQR